MGIGVFDPENYCPICGQKLPSSHHIQDHSCPPNSLSAIDGAGNRDDVLVRTPHLAERLKEGFALLKEDDEPESLESRYLH